MFPPLRIREPRYEDPRFLGLDGSSDGDDPFFRGNFDYQEQRREAPNYLQQNYDYKMKVGLPTFSGKFDVETF